MPAAPESAEPGYVLWTHIGSESVFFYPPGSIEEHLVTEHGVPSVNMHWRPVRERDHRPRPSAGVFACECGA